MVVQIFYNGVTQPVRSMIDAAAGGTLMIKTEEEAFNLIEEMALNNYQWSNERGHPRGLEASMISMLLLYLLKKMDATTGKLDKLNVNVVNSYPPSPSCDKCGSHGHVSENCQVGNPFAPSLVEHVAYVNNFQPRLNHTHIPIPIILVGSSTQTSPIELTLYPFHRLMLGLHPPDFEDHPFLYKLHHLKKSNFESMLESVLLA